MLGAAPALRATTYDFTGWYGLDQGWEDQTVSGPFQDLTITATDTDPSYPMPYASTSGAWLYWGGEGWSYSSATTLLTVAKTSGATFTPNSVQVHYYTYSPNYIPGTYQSGTMKITGYSGSTQVAVWSYFYNGSGNDSGYSTTVDFSTVSGFTNITSLVFDADRQDMSIAYLHMDDVLNSAPTDISLSASSINQSAGANATVGTLSSTDPDTGDTFTYSLVSGTGSANNALFTISGSTLKALNAATMGAGAYSVRIRTTDSANNTFEKAFTVTVVDNVAPGVVSITRQTPAGQYVNVSQVIYQVAFSESVTNVSASSFAVTPVGSSTVSGSVASVSGGLQTYAVTVNIASGEGQLRLDMPSTSIRDTNGNLISNLPYSGGAVYTCDITRPTVTIGAPSTTLTTNAPVSFSVSYSDTNFAGATLDSSKVTVNGTGTAAASTVTVTGSGTSWTVTLSGISGDGTLGISLAANTAWDSAGNYASAAGPSATFTVDNTAPVINSSLSASGVYSNGFSYTISATGSPVSFSVTNLPAGLGLANGVISGTPTVVGTYQVGLFATDSVGNRGFSLLTLTIAPAPATVVLSGLSQSYSGTARPVSASTTPAGLTVNLTYNGSSVAPTNAGSYTVIGTVSDTLYAGAATNTLQVSQASLIVKADDQSRLYGQTNPVFTVSYNGFVNGDGVSQLSPQPTAACAATAASSRGTYEIVVSGGSSINYSLTSSNGTLTVNKAPLTMVGNDAVRAYGQTNPVFTAVATGVMNSDNITPKFTTVATVTTAPGRYPVYLNVSDPDGKLGNYDVQKLTAGYLTITNALLTGQVASQSRSYGMSNAPFGVAYSGFVNGENTNILSGTMSFSCLDTNGAVVGPASAPGTYPILATTSQSTSNYTVTYLPGNLTITQAVLTIAADSYSRLYGATNPTLTASYQGFMNGETNTALSGTLSLATSATTNSPVGQYPITPSGLSSANYSLSNQVGTLTVLPAGLTVAIDSASRLYGQTNPLFSGTLSGVTAGDSLSATYSSAATQASPVTTYDILPVWSDPGSRLGNYTVTTNKGTLTVGRAPLTVAADSCERIYGTTNPVFTASYSGFVNSETVGVLSGSPAFTTTATTNSPVGPYTITPTNNTLSAANYSFSFGNGTLTVTQAVLTVTADHQSRLYGQPNPPLTVSYSGFAAGDTTNVLSGAPSLSTSAQTNSPVGDYTIVVGTNTLSATNYSFNLVNGTLSIARAQLLVLGDDCSRAYGQTNPTFSVTITGLNPDDGIVPILGTDATTNSPAGGYDINVSLQDPNDRLGSYDLFIFGGTLTVTNAVLTGQVVSQVRTYGQPNAPFAVQYSGFANGQSTSILSGALTFSCTDGQSVAVGTNTPVGIYTIHASGQAAANYDVAFEDGSLTIDPATLTVTANDTNRLYGAANPAFTSTLSGFVNADTAAVVGGQPALSTLATVTSPVGPYLISATNGTLSATNYLFTFASGSLTVDKATLGVVADDTNRTYGAVNPAFTPSYSGFLNGDTATVLSGQPSLTTLATLTSPAGTYGISATNGTLSATNYAFSFTNGTLTVTRAALLASADAQGRVYGVANPALTISYSGFVNGETNTVLQTPVTAVTSATNTSPVGSYAIVLSGGSDTNYSVTLSNGWLTVSKATVVAAADAQGRFYGATNPPLTISYSGFANGETASVLEALPTASTTATTNSAVNTYAITLSGGSDTNYLISLTNGVLTVNPAPLTVSADAKSRGYGLPNPPLTVSYSGFVNNETSSVLTTPVSAITVATLVSPVGSYPITLSGGVAANYSLTLTPGNLSITPGQLTIGANSVSRPYGATNPVFTGTINGFPALTVVTNIPSGAAWPSPLLPDATAQTYTLTNLANASFAQSLNVGGATSVLGQTFTTATNFTLGEIDLYASVLATPASPLPLTFNLYDLTGDPILTNANPGYRPADANGGVNLLGGGAGVTYTFTNSVSSAILQLLFGSSNQVALQSNHVYAFEVEGATTANFSWQYDMWQTSSGNLVKASSTTNLVATILRAPVGGSVRAASMAVYAASNASSMSLTFDTLADTNTPAGTYGIVPSLVDPSGVWTNYVVSTNNGVLTITAALALNATPGFYVVSLPAINVDTNATLADGGSLVFSNATLVVRVVTNASVGDQLGVLSQGSGTNQIRVSGSAVSYGTLPMGTFSGGSGTNALVVALTTNATSTTLMALLHQVSFSTTNTNTALRAITATLNYAGNQVSASRLLTLDRRPVAVGDIVYATAGQVLTIPYSMVLSNDYDVDNDGISLIANSLVSSLGGWVDTDGSSFIYEPPSDSLTQDNFAYIISDGRGGQSAGVITIHFLVANQLSIDAGGMGANGATLSMGGVPGSVYAIEASTNFVHWTRISTNTASGTGLLQFMDTDSKTMPMRFYRAVAQ